MWMKRAMKCCSTRDMDTLVNKTSKIWQMMNQPDNSITIYLEILDFVRVALVESTPFDSSKRQTSDLLELVYSISHKHG